MLNYYENMVGLSLRSGQHNEAITHINSLLPVLDKLDSASETYIKYFLTVMLIYLSRDDWVAAKTFLDQMKERFVLCVAFMFGFNYMNFFLLG